MISDLMYDLGKVFLRRKSMNKPFHSISDLISIRDLNLDQVLHILQVSQYMKQQMTSAEKCPEIAYCLHGKIIASSFFEASTRTRLSFESASLRLGAQVIGFANDTLTSTTKGESLKDSIQMLSNYADLIIIRHPRAGAAQLAAEVSDKPIINAGDGSNQHPTQALIDLFTIQECQTQLTGLSIALAGDLKYSRTIHSLVQLCALFKMRLFLVSQSPLTLPDSICDELKWQGICFSHHTDLEKIIPRIDIIYMTRLQRERLSTAEKLLLNTPSIRLTTAMLSKAQKHLKVLHPLPRLDELDTAIDQTHYAHYFTQASNGVYVRQALLSLLLNPEARIGQLLKQTPAGHT